MEAAFSRRGNRPKRVVVSGIQAKDAAFDKVFFLAAGVDRK
jgi:hypothetical protein